MELRWNRRIVNDIDYIGGYRTATVFQQRWRRLKNYEPPRFSPVYDYEWRDIPVVADA